LVKADKKKKKIGVDNTLWLAHSLNSVIYQMLRWWQWSAWQKPDSKSCKIILPCNLKFCIL